jgi:hypothetical protein
MGKIQSGTVIGLVDLNRMCIKIHVIFFHRNLVWE